MLETSQSKNKRNKQRSGREWHQSIKYEQEMTVAYKGKKEKGKNGKMNYPVSRPI